MVQKFFENLDQCISDFLSRDYISDVRYLNENYINEKFNFSNFAEYPPQMFVGNPSLLKPNKNIFLLGLNPKWLGFEHKWFDTEYRLWIEAVNALQKERNLSKVYEEKTKYFSENSNMYYGRYFTKLGNGLGSSFLKIKNNSKDKIGFSKNIFNNFIFKTDIIPWHSKDTKGIDFKKLVDEKPECFMSYMSFLKDMFSNFDPMWIHCNGLQSRELIEMLFDTTLIEYQVADKEKNFRILIGKTKLMIDDNFIEKPIIMHAFSNSPTGPSNSSNFNRIADKFFEITNINPNLI